MRFSARHIRNLKSDQSGAVAVEFGIWVVAFFLAVSVAMDFGMYYLERGKMNEAVSGAAVASFTDADNVNFTLLPGYVRNLADNQAMTVTTSCNGTTGSCTNLNRSCACIKNDGGYVATTCGNMCTGTDVTAGSTAGYYLSINASQSFSPMILPRSLLADSTIQQHATVRLQ